MRYVPHITRLLPLMLLLVMPALAAAAPTARPPNDARANAQPLGALPVHVRGTTGDATREPRDPTSCSAVGPTVWYALGATRDARVVLRLKANGDLDATVVVYRRVRSQLEFVACDLTNSRGEAATTFEIDEGERYLILIAERRDSEPGTFVVDLFSPEPPATPPGAPLPRRGVRSSVDPLTDGDDAYSLTMAAGRTYRLNLTSERDECVGLLLYPPRIRSFAETEPLRERFCGGYMTFTPGPDGGGRYVLRLVADEDSRGTQRYRLQAAPATRDDTAPGIPIASGTSRRGGVSASTLDVLDLYRFEVAKRSDVSLRLRAGRNTSFDLVLLTDRGRRLRCECEGTGERRLRIRAHPGRYHVAVRARRGDGRYRLSLLVRQITTTHTSIAGSRNAQVPPGRTVTLRARVSSRAAAGGQIRLQVDKFDPLEGWQFFRLFKLRAGSDGSVQVTWLPPSVGRWRAHSVFFGTGSASPSESGYARLLVAAPLRRR